MNTEQPQLDLLKRYLNLFFDWHKLIIGCLLIAVSAGYAFYLFIPKVYQSTASLIYQQQQINPSKFSPDEEKRLEDMVNTVAQQVTSRTSLEKIIKDFNLYRELLEKVPIEDVIARMRTDDIHINVQRTKGNVFSVSFQGKDPALVMRVTNSLASRFIEENLRVREERATETTSYVQDELRMSKESLDKKDALMRDYKLKYYNEMPDHRESNMARINALHEQFQATQTNIHTLEQTRLLVSEQLANQKSRMNAATNSSGSGPTTGGNTDLAGARKLLQNLLARYTPDHPAVKRAEKQVKQLEMEQDSLPVTYSNTKNKSAVSVSPLRGNNTNDFSIQLKEIELNLKNLRDENEKILSQIKTYQEWIDASPIREAEWTALTRDYSELKKYYDALLSQSLTAAAAESIEMRQKGSQFKLVDPAYLPEKPITGNFLKIIMMAIVLGLASGCGLVLGFDFMDTSFKDVLEIERYLQVPVTCALPFISLATEEKEKKKKNMLWYCFFAVWLLSLAATTIFLWHRGNIIL
ncbi:MAG: Wzz/FepE/Etk N-terminal domain-containing protein [Gammaproteobacteria bacterium]|nr:Wzz/FepE/Etk N-terminal domain-containing protein [Gammaproteobacteria bacterium]